MTAIEIYETRQSIFTMCLITLRGIIVMMVLGFGFLLAILTIRTADAATLKPMSTVNDDVIRLGDVFGDISDTGNAVLGRAPLPGSDMILNARTLMRIASTYSIDWKPQSVTDQAIIRREAHTVSTLDIQDAVWLGNCARTSPSGLISTERVSVGMVIPGRSL